jgi:TrmH family RNA methyltransferase
VRRLSSSQFRSAVNSKNPQGIAAVVAIPQHSFSAKLPENPGSRILLFDDIQDPGNTGSLIRTGVALGFDGVLMTEKCADPFSPKCVQASAGTVLSLWVRRCCKCEDMVKQLVVSGYSLIAADMQGIPPLSTKVNPPLILALGNEGNGISEKFRKMASLSVCIPIAKNRAESLNVAAAGAICMYCFS